LNQLEQWVHGGLQPDLTIWFDLPAELAEQRRTKAREADRFEKQDLGFFERVRNGYLARLENAPQRFARIDAALDRDAVWLQIDAALKARSW
jgi:dTMP kinase